MSSSFNLPWSTLSYTDDAGIVHFFTEDGLPPNDGYPPYPGYELQVFPHSPRLLPLPDSNSLLPGCVTPAAPSADPSTSATDASATAPSTIPQPRAIGCYIFRPVRQPLVELPIQFVKINFIANGVRPHQDRFTGRNRDEEILYTACRAATIMKMNDLIKTFEGGGARGFTECKLLSDGRSWAKVQTFKLGDDSLGKTLGEIGWTESRGVDGPPVWVCAYHEGLDDEEEESYWKRLGFLLS